VPRHRARACFAAKQEQVQTAQFGDVSSFRNHIFDSATTHPVERLTHHLATWFLAIKTDTFRLATEFADLPSEHSPAPAKTAETTRP
jgi:hypothetical protein